jgi:hypothetical protein
MTQEEINDMVQSNVDHLEIILAYAPVDENDETQMSQVTRQISLAIQMQSATGKYIYFKQFLIKNRI